MFRSPSWHCNLRQQQVKSPKLHFFDPGFVCNLLGIRNPRELLHHSLRGQFFESWVASGIYKQRAGRGLPVDILHYRETRGIEIDILVQGHLRLIACEAKSGAT